MSNRCFVIIETPVFVDTYIFLCIYFVTIISLWNIKLRNEQFHVSWEQSLLSAKVNNIFKIFLISTWWKAYKMGWRYLPSCWKCAFYPMFVPGCLLKSCWFLLTAKSVACLGLFIWKFEDNKEKSSLKFFLLYFKWNITHIF